MKNAKILEFCSRHLDWGDDGWCGLPAPPTAPTPTSCTQKLHIKMRKSHNKYKCNKENVGPGSFKHCKPAKTLEKDAALDALFIRLVLVENMYTSTK